MALREVKRIHVIHNDRWAIRFRAWKNSLRWQPTEDRYEPPVICLRNTGAKTVEDRRGSVGDLAWLAEGHLGWKNPQGVILLCGDNVFYHPPVRYLYGDELCITVRRIEEVHPSSAEGLGRVRVVDGRVEAVGLGVRDSPWVYAGPAFFPPGTLRYVAEFDDLCRKSDQLPDDLGAFWGWLAQQETVRALNATGAFFDVGTKESYRAAVRHGRAQQEAGRTQRC